MAANPKRSTWRSRLRWVCCSNKSVENNGRHKAAWNDTSSSEKAYRMI